MSIARIGGKACFVLLMLSAGALRADELDLEHIPCFGMNIGYLHKGKLYSVDRAIRDQKGESLSKTRVWAIPFLPRIGGPGTATFSYFKGFNYGKGIVLGIEDTVIQRLHWRIAEGAFWAGDVIPGGQLPVWRIPWDDMAFYEASNAHGEAMHTKKYSGAPGMGSGDAYYYLPLVDFGEEVTRKQGRWGPLGGEVEEGSVQYDWLPLPDDSVVAFALCENQLTIWHQHGKCDQPNDVWPRTTEGGTIPAGFQEAFFALKPRDSESSTERNEYYFITASGSVYRCWKKETKPRVVEALWKAPGHPIRGFISDVESGRIFVFGSVTKPVDGGAPEDTDRRFYFELPPWGDWIDCKYYSQADVKDLKYEGPVKKVVDYVQVLEKAKLLPLKKRE